MPCGVGNLFSIERVQLAKEFLKLIFSSKGRTIRSFFSIRIKGFEVYSFANFFIHKCIVDRLKLSEAGMFDGNLGN